jgi:eukaryotic-like serine/threonine-protein kinase
MLPAGTRLGPYEVLGPLGAGGMGEVYRARDSRLSRSVALKILPDAFARDADRVARFQREAEMLASLNHPHIGSIYDVALDGDVPFLVLELVDGDTLADRIARGPLPLASALDVARQIADALDGAHARGIIHRDLKPANIKVSADGKVKVLDFGLAKMHGHDLGVSAAETAIGVTSAGTIIGTTAYMSPEQARGQDADRRSDVWAFGCVLFEMLSGRQVFDGGSGSEVLANVLKSEPEWDRLPADTPESIRRLLRRCLQKDDKRRLRDIGDTRLEIDEASGGAVTSPTTTRVSIRRGERYAWAAGTVALALIAAMAGIGAMRSARASSTAPAETRFDVATPGSDPLDLTAVAVSADGRQLLFVANSEGQPTTWLRSLDSVAARPLAGTGGSSYPFWSPDGRSIGFFANGGLHRLDLDGGLVRELTKATFGVGGTWNRDGVILFSHNPASGIWRVNADGRGLSEVTRLEPGHGGHSFAHFLPDGKHFIYYVAAATSVRGIYIGALDGSASKRLLDADSSAVYNNGHLLFFRQATLLAQPFDVEALELKATPFQVAEDGIGRAGGLWTAPPAAGGAIAYRAGTVQFGKRFVWFNRSGEVVGSVGNGLEIVALALWPSPDGNQAVFFQRGEATSNIWTIDIRRGVVSRLTSETGENIFPVWSRDGSRVIYSSNRTGKFGLYSKRLASGEPSEVVLAGGPGETFATDTTADGRIVLYQQRSLESGWDIWSVPLTGGQPSAVLQTASDEGSAQLSPDGKWMAYSGNASGEFEVYLRPFPGPGQSLQVSAKGGTQLRWGPDGRELYYVATDSKLMAVSVGTAREGQPPPLGTPVALFAPSTGRVLSPTPNADFFPSSDGQRFLVSTVVQDAGKAPLRVILNWKPQAR